MKLPIPLFSALLLSALLAGCVIDDSGSSGYYGDGGYYRNDYPPPPPRRDAYGYRRDPYYDEYEYDRGYRDGRRADERDRRHHDDRRRHDDRHSGSGRSGEFSAGGSAKEFSFPSGCRHCTIEVVDGSVGFRTIVVRRGGAKQSVTINATYQRGQRFDVPIDGQATGLRISDTGRGRYRVVVR